jgi:hypothetical protein
MTVCLDVNTHARLAAAAALRGMDRSAFAAEAIRTALVGYVVIDRRSKPADGDDPSGEEVSAA